jgi:hypothetical protein
MLLKNISHSLVQYMLCEYIISSTRSVRWWGLGEHEDASIFFCGVVANYNLMKLNLSPKLRKHSRGAVTCKARVAQLVYDIDSGRCFI